MNSDTLGSFFPVILVTLFNAGDTMGRFVSQILFCVLCSNVCKVLTCILSVHCQVPNITAVSDWMVTPVGKKIVNKSGEHLGNGRPKMYYSIALPLALRLAFYPIIIFCVNPLYIASDAARMVIIILFSMTNGWVFSGCYMLASEVCRQLKHKEAAALLMIVSTLLALGIGSSVGLGIASAVTA
jgi:hypothetical protein